MGQKTNPNIFRIGNTEEWKSKYFEKKSTESSIYIFKDLEIKKFISKFMRNNGLTIQDIKLYYFEGGMHIFISYFLTLKSISLINNLNKTQKIKLIQQTKEYKQQKSYKRKYNKIRKSVKKHLNYQKLKYNIILKKLIKRGPLKKAKRIINNEKYILKIRRIRLLKYYKKYLSTKNYKNIINIKINSFLEKFFKSLSLFINQKQNIFLTLQQLNKDVKQTITQKKIKLLKKSLVQLRKYKQNEFFKEGVNLLFTSTTNEKSALLLAQFIADQLKKLKRHNFFLKFIKTTLALFSSKTFSNIEGIKIKIKGRFNGAPRAKHKIIKIGSGVPVLTLNSNINYSETTSYTSNGTFGVKVWICEK